MVKNHAAFLFLASVGYLYLQNFRLPCIPIYQGDNTSFFLLDAVRMLGGEVLYRDFLELIFPGMPALDALLLDIFGIRAWIPAATLVAVGLALTCVAAMLARRLLTGISVFLPPVAYLTLAFGNALDDTHHWFSILACLAAVAVLLDDRRFRTVCVAGGLCGVAACFTQTRGVAAMVALASFLAWDAHTQKLGNRWWIKRLGGLAAGFFTVVIPFLLYFIRQSGWSNFYYSTFVFTARYYRFFHRNNLSAYMVDVPIFDSLLLSVPALSVWLFIHLLIPMIYPLFLVTWWRNRERIPHPLASRLMLISLMGLAFCAAIASAPTWLRMASSTLPGLILLAWFLEGPNAWRRIARQTLWGISVVVAIGGVWITQSSAGGPLQTPTGRMAVVSADRYEKYQWLLPRVSPQQYVLDTGNGDAYFPLELRDPASVPFLTLSAYTRPQQISDLLITLDQRKVKYIIWPVELDLTPLGNFGDDPLPALRKYLKQKYHVVKVFRDGDQVWQRAGE